MLRRTDLVERCAIEAVVGPVPDRRWHRGSLRAAGPDGVTRGEWFERAPADRVDEVIAFLRNGHWSPPALRPVLKGTGETRPTTITNTVEQAAAYVLHDRIAPLARAGMTRLSLAYQPGKTLGAAILDTMGMARRHRYVVSPDIRHFFDEIDWRHLDRAVSALAIDDDLRAWIMEGVMVPFVGPNGRVVRRSRGIAQGSVPAPTLANLYLAGADARLARRLGRIGVELRRSSDNYLLAADSVDAARKAIAILSEELRRVRLAIKPGTTAIHDLCNPRNAPVWLGVAFIRDKAWVPTERIERRAAEYQCRLERGELDASSIEERLQGLERFYRTVVGQDQAEAAAEKIRQRIDTSVAAFTKGGVQDLRSQLLLDRADVKTLSHPSVPDRMASGAEEESSASTLPSGTKVPIKTGNVRITTPKIFPKGRLSALERQEAIIVPPMDGQGSSHGAERSHVGVKPSLGTAPCLSRYTLRALTTEPGHPGDDPDLHHRRLPGQNPDAAVMARSSLEESWVLRAFPQPSGKVFVDARRDRDDFWWFDVFDVHAQSAPEGEAAGLAEGLRLLQRQHGVVAVDIVVSDPTLVGYLRSGWRVRSPLVWRRMRELLAEIEASRPCLAWFALPEGKRVPIPGQRGRPARFRGGKRLRAAPAVDASPCQSHSSP